MNNVEKSKARTMFDLFNFPFDFRYKEFMRTDIEETSDTYIIKIEVPSVKKEDIEISLKDGCLTVSVEKREENEEKESNRIIHKERFYGSFKRSYDVGDLVREKDISASLEDGLLTLNVNKPEVIKEKETTKYIKIK